MSTPAMIALTAIALVGLASVVIGSFGVQLGRSTSDFVVASRTVGSVSNAGAIAGEYLSAASFLGMAGLILREGADGLWYPVAFAAGFLALLLFVAAPMRRSGAYTVPDFAEVRLASTGLRRLCTALVLIIGWLYLLPQLQGAGLALTVLTPLPSWTGELVAAAVVLLTVIGDGMRSITFVQAFQYWLKLTAMAVPAVVVLAFFLTDSRSLQQPTAPQFTGDTTVSVQADVLLDVTEPTRFTADGELDGLPVRGQVFWTPGRHDVGEGATLTFAGGTPIPTVAGAPTTDESWLEPLSGDEGPQLLEIYSILVAAALGTMGLPHVLVRFYSNPDGRAARRTAVVVLAMVGGFFVLVNLVGALSRLYTPQLLVTGQSDAAVLLVPTGALGATWWGLLLGGLVAAGAAAAFLSTMSGLLVSLGGVLITDVLPGPLRNRRLAPALSLLPPLVLALTVPRLDFAISVPMVLALAASTFCPLLVLGVWWRGLTARGATAGVLVGGGLCLASITYSQVFAVPPGWLGVLLYRPAAVTVPLAFLVMVVVSRWFSTGIPPDTDAAMLRLHAPERLGLQSRPVGRRPRPIA